MATAGAEIAALDVVESTHKNVVVAITCKTAGQRRAVDAPMDLAVAEGVITACDSGRVVHSANLIHS